MLQATFQSNIFVKIFTLLILFYFFSGCKIPRVAIKQPAALVNTFSKNNHKIKQYSVGKYKPDTLNKLLKYEYLAKDIFIIESPKDTNKTILVCAWQEYLWRISAKLDEVEKPYYTPIIAGFSQKEDSITITWNYPNLDERDKDLKYAAKRRNNYWSVDLFNVGKQIKEVYSTTQLSYPIEDKYNPQNKFIADGTYLFSLRDTTLVQQEALKFIDIFTKEQASANTQQKK